MEYLDKIKDLIETLEQGNTQNEIDAKAIKCQKQILNNKEEKLRAVENDVNAKLRIVGKYDDLEKEKALVKANNLSNKEELQRLLARAKKVVNAEKSLRELEAKIKTDKDVVNGKLKLLKDRETAMNARESRFNSGFIAKLEKELS